MTMLHNVGVNTDSKRRNTDGYSGRSSSLKLKERNVKHTRINNIKDLNDIYIYGEMLGRGVFGTVVEITDKTTKKIWALKIVDKKSVILFEPHSKEHCSLNMTKGSKINTIENEIKILRMVNHPHIVYLERTFESYKHIYLVIERCTTELANILKLKKKFSEAEARKVMDHLSSAIAYLHKYEIIHRDLKMENILTAPNPNDPADELYIKVSDFGLGIIKSCSRPDQMLSDRCGTLTYMAPEIISRASYSQQCDVWAMGVICYLILTGHYPFYSKTENELTELICSREPSYNGFKAGSDAAHLITKMLDKNPALRISAAEVCRHPWIRGSSNGSSTPNVLDMMQLWRSEMMVPPTDNDSDWAQAFSSLQISTESSNPQEIDKPVQGTSIPNVNALPSQVSSKLVKDHQMVIKTVATKSVKKLPPKSSTTSRPSRQADRLDAQKVNLNLAACRSKSNQVNERALSVKGKNTKLIRIGKDNRVAHIPSGQLALHAKTTHSDTWRRRTNFASGDSVNITICIPELANKTGKHLYPLFFIVCHSINQYRIVTNS